MNRRGIVILGLAVVTVTAAVAAGRDPNQNPKPAPTAKPAANAGWQLPPEAEETKNPLEADPKVIATGKAVYEDKCQRCHGPGGLGDGPDADPDHREDMDLTNAKRADRNADGVMFYKVWNGRKKPKMPAFKEELTEEQVWTVITYAKTLRKEP
jgi:mono/diheme cytochrome c family protein